MAGRGTTRSGTGARGSSRARESEPIRITEAAGDPADDMRKRQRRYLFSMGVRTLCVVGAVLATGTWAMWVFLVGAVFLPYVAVVMANAAGPRDDGFRLVPGAGRTQALPPGEDPGDPGDPGDTDHRDQPG